MNVERGDAAKGKREECMDEVADRGLAEPVESGGGELEGRLAGREDAGEEGSVDFRGGREDKDITLAEILQLAEEAEELVAHDLGLAPSAVTTMDGEGAVGRRCGEGFVEGVDAGLDTAEE
jgi:hypothetical protein